MIRDGPSLRILIPACNESHRIVPTLVDYCEHFKNDATIAVIANACTDDTVQITERLTREYENLELIAINGRIGKGGAIRTGLTTGCEEYVGFADADGSTSAAEFARLFNKCLNSGASGVIGSRWLPGAVLHPRQPLFRRWASRAFNVVVRTIFGLPFADTQCGAKVFKRAALQKVLRSLEIADFAFDIDVLWNLRRRGQNVIEVPTVWSDRAAESKIDIIPTASSMLLTILRIRLHDSWISRLPLFEFLASSSVIPVRNGIKVLVLGAFDGDAQVDGPRAWLAACIREWERANVTLIWANHGGAAASATLRWWPARLWRVFRTLAWYVFSSRRDFDALVEVGSEFPAIIPCFSAKKSFLIRPPPDVQSPLPSRLIYESLYRRTNVIHISDSEPPERWARQILEIVGIGGPYRAAFQESEEGWVLRFSDLQSGTLTHKSLR